MEVTETVEIDVGRPSAFYQPRGSAELLAIVLASDELFVQDRCASRRIFFACRWPVWVEVYRDYEECFSSVVYANRVLRLRSYLRSHHQLLIRTIENHQVTDAALIVLSVSEHLMKSLPQVTRAFPSFRVVNFRFQHQWTSSPSVLD